MPERLTSNRKVIGTKQLRKALKAGRVQTAYVAADADPILREPLVEQCRDAGVELVEIDDEGTREALRDPCRRSLRRTFALKCAFFWSQRNIFDISG